MADTRPNYSIPSAIRSVTSYPARRVFKQGPIDPLLDYVIGVDDSIDIHCHHAHEEQQDAQLRVLAKASVGSRLIFCDAV